MIHPVIALVIVAALVYGGYKAYKSKPFTVTKEAVEKKVEGAGETFRKEL